MKRLKLICLFAFIPILSFSQYVLQEGYISFVPYTESGGKFTYKNLRIYPLMGGELFHRAHEGLGDYVSLENAIEDDKVLITEKSSGDLSGDLSLEVEGEVNLLFVENVSTDTLYLMSGEVVKGGKQDRVLAQDIILPPASGKVEAPVFCVEHNRWSAGEDGGNFEEYYSVSSNDVRSKAVKEKSQSGVWEAVKKIVVSMDAESSTGTYAALKDSRDYNDALKEYQDFFLKQFAESKNVIGFVGVTGDRIIGCDIFATPDLFSGQFENLLCAYIAEVIRDGGCIEVEDEDVLAYLQEFLTNEATQDEVVNSKGMEFKHKGKKIHLNTF